MKTGYDAHFKKLKKNSRFQVKTEAKKSSHKDSSMPIKRKRKKQKFPLGSVVIMFCVLGGVGYGYINPDRIDHYVSKIEKMEFDIKKIEIGFLGKVDAQDVSPQQNIPNNSANAATSAETKTLDEKPRTSAVTGLTPEEIALFNSLDERKRQLDAKEAELKKLEEELHNQKVELENRLASLEQLRTQIANQLQERVETDEERVNKLVSFYSSMKPVTAAKIIENINEDLAVEVLKKMKKKEAAEIMNMIASDKAKRLSEKFAGYKK